MGVKQWRTWWLETGLGNYEIKNYTLILALDNTSDYWVVDSRDSCHATPHRKLFHDYVPSDFGHVLLGDDEQGKIVGMGKVHIKLNNGN